MHIWKVKIGKGDDWEIKDNNWNEMTKEWVAANSEVHVFFCWFWETMWKHVKSSPFLKSRRKTINLTNFGLLKDCRILRKKLETYDIITLLGGKPFFDKFRIRWKFENSEKKMRDMSHHHPLKSGRKHVFDKHVQFPNNFHKVGNKSANRASNVQTWNNLGKMKPYHFPC